MMRRALLPGLTLILGACGGMTPGSEGGVLDGTQWRAVQLDGAPVPEGVAPTMIVAGGAATGFGGCAGYSSAIQLWGTAIAFGAVLRTEGPCTMDQSRLEATYLLALTNSVRAEIANDRLTLRDKDAKVRLRFIRTDTD
jgi:heat shock protein HslJ